jgi:ribosomal peptide maturation radical SAM protein 1
LADLTRRYRSFEFAAVDNILDPSYLEKLFKRLSQTGVDYEIFYEVKANLTREQIKVLCEGGIRRLQPGIESLSSRVLKLMRKGATAIQNLNTLRWARYYGIRVGWNLLWGFPGERIDDYQGQLNLLKRITHLEPPRAAGRIWMERYSPIFAERCEFPAKFVRPEASYGYVYPRRVDLERVAYYFDYELENTLPDESFDETCRHVESWQSAWENETWPTLTYRYSPEFLQIEDRRDSNSPMMFSFIEPLGSIYAACSDRPLPPDEVRRRLQLDQPEREIEDLLVEFCNLGLMMREGHSFLSLAIPARYTG